MKIATLIKGMLAFSTASFIGASLHAQNPDGDLMLDFRSTDTSAQGGSYNLEIDLGSFTNFLPGGTYAPVVFQEYDLGSLLSVNDLDSTSVNGGFGPNWDSDGLIKWSVVGTTRTAGESGLADYTLFGTVNDSSTPVGGTSDQETSSGLVEQMVSELGSYSTTSNSSDSYFVPITDPASYNGKSGGTSPFFGYFGDSFETTASGNSSANLFLIQPGEAGQDLGTFTLESNGGLEFESVPEPSTWATFALGIAALIGLGQRRSRVARFGIPLPAASAPSGPAARPVSQNN